MTAHGVRLENLKPYFDASIKRLKGVFNFEGYLRKEWYNFSYNFTRTFSCVSRFISLSRTRQSTGKGLIKSLNNKKSKISKPYNKHSFDL